MQDSMTIQTPVQPFIDLVQGNMALITRFSLAPEVISQTMANAQAWLQREPGAPNLLARSDAFGELVQGMLNNYTKFLAELSQSGMALLVQGQAAMMQDANEATETAATKPDSRGKRSR